MPPCGPPGYARLKKEAEERATRQMEEKGEFDKLREKWRADQEKKESEFKAKLAEKDSLLRKLHLDREVRESALKAGSGRVRCSSFWPPAGSGSGGMGGM